MKTRNYIILSALTLASALVISSCSADRDEVNGFSTAMSNTISVNAMVGSDVTTRAFADEQNTTSDDLTSICLSAWNADAQTMTNATYSKSNDAWSTTSGPYYWATGAYTFIAWAKNNAAATATDILGSGATESTTQVTGTYTVERSVTDGGSNPTASQNDPVLAVATYTGKPDNNSVDLQFQHLLSRISVNIYAPMFLDSTVCLLDFGFNNVSTSGTFTYATTSATKEAFGSSCWTSPTTGNVGEWADSDDSNANYWWTAYTGNNPSKAVKPTAENASSYGYGPIVPKAMDTSFPKLTTYYTASETNTAVTSAPWLNVIPGSKVAENLQIRFNIYQNGAWTVQTVKVSLADLKVNNETLNEYKPGYQYVYNIRVLGQNTDDAEESKATVSVQGVTATEWNSSSTKQQKTTDIGVGNSLQALIDKIAANGGYGTIKLTENVVLDSTVTIPDGCNISIDLAGYDITTNADSTVNPLFKVAKGGELTFEDTGREVTESGQTTTKYGSVTAKKNTSIIKLEDGDGTKAGGKATINGGTFNVSGDDGAVIETGTGDNKGTSVINGGTFNKTEYTEETGNNNPFSGSTPTINGGTFKGGYEPGDGDLPKGYTKVYDSTSGTYIIVPDGQVPGAGAEGGTDAKTAD